MPVTETSVLTNLHDLFAIEDARTRTERLDAERRAAADRERRAAELAERQRRLVEAEARERHERDAAEQAAAAARRADELAAREHASRLETERLVAIERVRAEAGRTAEAAERRARDELTSDVRRLRRTVAVLVASFVIGIVAAGFAFARSEQSVVARAHAQELELLRARSELTAARAARDASRDENRTLRDRIAVLESAVPATSATPVAGAPRPRPPRDPDRGTSGPGLTIRRCSGPLGCL